MAMTDVNMEEDANINKPWCLGKESDLFLIIFTKKNFVSYFCVIILNQIIIF